MWSSTNHASWTHQFWPLPYIKTCERRSGMWGSRANCLNILEVCVMCTWQKESGNSSLILAHCCSGRATNNTAHCRQTGKQWQAADTFLEKDLSVWTVDASGTSSCVHPRVTANAFLCWYQIQKAGFHQRFRSDNYFCVTRKSRYHIHKDA